jgi:hypothetical protein
MAEKRTHDERLNKAADPSRDSRSVNDDRSSEGDGLVASAAERRRMNRNEWLHEALPKPPTIPGWHICWLTTTSQYDSIVRRQRLGYELVKADEVPGWENQKMHSGEYAGFIMVNEMILSKIPLALYQEHMREIHHVMPLEEERAIAEGARRFADETRDSSGQELMRLEEGTSELGRHVRPPPTFE